jgi:hypothetical protein
MGGVTPPMSSQSGLQQFHPAHAHTHKNVCGGEATTWVHWVNHWMLPKLDNAYNYIPLRMYMVLEGATTCRLQVHQLMSATSYKIT